MTKKFQKNVENFTCEKCGESVVGTGYTDHCPVCLYSKHVDINPGDRASGCGGLMEPASVESIGGEYKIYYICQRCGYKHRVKSAPADNFDVLAELSGKPLR